MVSCLLISTNYGANDWKRMYLFLGAFLAIALMPIIIFSQVLFVPGLDAWVQTFSHYNNVVMEIINNQYPDYEFSFAFVQMLNVCAAPIVLGYLFYLVIKISLSNARWITRKLNIQPLMNLVIFNNKKKLYELKL